MGGIYGFLSQMMEPEITSMLHGAGNALLATRPQREKQACHVRMTCCSHPSPCVGLAAAWGSRGTQGRPSLLGGREQTENRDRLELGESIRWGALSLGITGSPGLSADGRFSCCSVSLSVTQSTNSEIKSSPTMVGTVKGWAAEAAQAGPRAMALHERQPWVLQCTTCATVPGAL